MHNSMIGGTNATLQTLEMPWPLLLVKFAHIQAQVRANMFVTVCCFVSCPRSNTWLADMRPSLRKPSFNGPAHLTLARRSAPVAPPSSRQLASLGQGQRSNDGSAGMGEMLLHEPDATHQEPSRERRRADGSLQIGPLHVSDKVRVLVPRGLAHTSVGCQSAPRHAQCTYVNTSGSISMNSCAQQLITCDRCLIAHANMQLAKLSAGSGAWQQHAWHHRVCWASIRAPCCSQAHACSIPRCCAEGV